MSGGCRCWVLLALVWAGNAGAADWYDGARGPQDVYLGQALYAANQGAWFQGISGLLAAQKGRQIASEDAELLLAQMYFDYGVDQEASKRVESLLNKNSAKELRNRAWFDLARFRYRHGRLPEVENALGKIKGSLPGALQTEREVFQANLLVAQGRVQEALKLLKGLKGEPQWLWYGRYNLGALLLKQGRKVEGSALLTEVGAGAGGSEDLASLRDKANLTLGQVYLQEKQADKAGQAFEKVRLHGLYANQALLGRAWAYLDASASAKALAPLRALAGRHPAELSVQTAKTLLPYVLAQQGAKQEALAQYQQAVSSFEESLRQIDAAQTAVRQGRMIANLVDTQALDESDWQWQSVNLTDTPENRYLADLMATDAFQTGLRHGRDLYYLDRKLSQYAKDVGIYEDALRARWKVSQHRGPKIAVDLKAFDGVSKRRMTYDAELARVEKFSADMSLASTEEKMQLAKLDQLKGQLSRLPPKEAADYRARFRLLKGVLIWRIANDFPNRVRRLRDDMNRVDRIVNQAHRIRDSIAVAQEIILTQQQHDDFAQRIVSNRALLEQLRPRVKALLQSQLDVLQGMALEALAQRRKTLMDDLSRASFAVAQLYDQGTERRKP